MLDRTSRLPRAPVTSERRLVFLAALRRHGCARRAAREASPDGEGTCVNSFYALRRRDADFALAWLVAVTSARAPANLASPPGRLPPDEASQSQAPAPLPTPAPGS